MGKKKSTSAKDSSQTEERTVALNKKARFNYHFLETYEAGIVLTGAEIKSVRDGGLSLVESYVRPHEGELFLIGAYIQPYKHSDDPKYNPTRRRKLLMHKREIERLAGRVNEQGLTLVPVRVYLKKHLAKLEVALAKGKAAPDKRQSIKEREAKRSVERAMKMAKR